MDENDEAQQKWGFGVVAPIALTLWALWVLAHGTVTISGRRGSVPLVLIGWEAAAFAGLLLFGALYLFFDRFGQRSERLEGVAGIGAALGLVGAIGCLLAVLVAVVRKFVF